MESYERARSWLQECLLNHQVSCPNDQNALLPSRVIDTGYKNGSEKLHLHVSKKGDTGSWVALSHFWGNTYNHVINVDNLGSKMRSISLRELPRALKDAVKVTRYLRFRYLQVDSICILQGSDVAARADWLFESGRMRDYYKNCVLCIAVDDASSDRDGFLGTASRQNSKVAVSMSLDHWGLDKYCTIYLEVENSTRFESPARQRSALATRGWKLQKHLLSPRALYCTSEQLVGISNVNPEIFLSSDERIWLDMDPKRFFLTPSYGRSYIAEKLGPLRWYSLVDEYAGRSLTFETDRLIALAALTQEMGIQFGLTHWMGIWAGDVHDGLLWRTHGAVSIPKAFVAPSWSWASVGLEDRNSSQYELFPLAYSQLLLNYNRSSEIISLEIPSYKSHSDNLQSKKVRSRFKDRFVSKIIKVNEAQTQTVTGTSPEHVSLATDDPSSSFAPPERKKVVQKPLIQPTSNSLVIVQVGSVLGPELTFRNDGNIRTNGVICLILEPGAERETFKRVGLAQFPDSSEFDSYPWEMRTLVLV
ncbi:hypothetical protein BPOR_0410g00110 [Botrytis porri]|uniref:Heterokaryon incompatibility domain-containing protein n=2 Tax=Botrytis porri TaxID=87229 RepID=A0A4Z1KIG3_9HELO|nr:hypothetical protein BPOR_0410g00110 [Botrytis porri]